ncbi:MAG: argininosuccinate lyase [Phycisphaerales bacterium]|nr:argininosuccinate lyase [Phycisphaerales bacterium]
MSHAASNPPRRLWDKGATLDEIVHRFTVGDDPFWDMRLVDFDCTASAAHARTLHRAGLLSEADLRCLLVALREIVAARNAGDFSITPEQEDCHTAIEAFLTARCGDAGARIHTGRSRNDQVAAAMRMFMRAQALEWIPISAALARFMCRRIATDGATPLPGQTHMQPAMPSSIGQWLHAHVEAIIEQIDAMFDLLRRLDSCPLGTGAGFGVPLPLDREYTARLLGFARAQRNAIDVQNSRGRLERYFARVAADIGALLEKFAWDVILLSGGERPLLSLPEALTTGSSIMPQKRNPDVLELMRARAGRLRACVAEIEWTAAKLPSSYHRDLQMTKEPVFRAADDMRQMLHVAARVVQEVRVNDENCRAAMTPELYATQAAYALVRSGTPFREAYRTVAAQIRDGAFQPPPPEESQPQIVSAELLAELQGEISRRVTVSDTLLEHVTSAESWTFYCDKLT